MSKVLQFLVDLGSDADLRQRYQHDPVRVLAQTALSGAEREAVCSGDSGRVYAAAGLSGASLPPKLVSAPTSAQVCV